MYYVLNFTEHTFASCDNTGKADEKVKELIDCGCDPDTLIEVVDCSYLENRWSGSDFLRKRCEVSVDS